MRTCIRCGSEMKEDCTVYLIYTIIREPVGSYGLHYILLALGVTAGFIVLDRQKRKKLKAKEL